MQQSSISVITNNNDSSLQVCRQQVKAKDKDTSLTVMSCNIRQTAEALTVELSAAHSN